MIKNYLQIAYRTLVKNTTYSLINITGLGISLAASILLLLWVWDELSFDRFNTNVDRLYTAAPAFDKERKITFSTTPAPLAVFAKKELPAVADACRISDNGGILMQYKDKKFVQEKTCYADPSLFTMFSFPLLAGNKNKPFTGNRSMVVSATVANKYFGNEDPVGKVIRVDNKDNYTVTGVMKDMPENSSLRYGLVMPFDVLNEGYDGKSYWKSLNGDWGNYNYNTYFLLKPGANVAGLGKQLAAMHKRNTPNNNDGMDHYLDYMVQPLKDVHLYAATGEDNGAQTVKIFFVIAVVILLIACINYINLVTARATKRAKEVSVRKVIGAGRKHLFWQFITESVVVFVIAMALSVGLIFIAMPFYNSLSGKELSFSFFDSRVLLLYVAALVATVGLAGVYPALTLSSFSPALALKGMIPGLGRNATFRKTLVVVQFTCSVVLIISTVIIGQQLTYIRQKNLGLDRENIFSLNSQNFLQHRDAIRAELEKAPGIAGVTFANNDVLNIGSSTGDIEWEGKPADMSNFMVSQVSAASNFTKVLNIQMAAGEGFNGMPSDSGKIVLNETAIQQMHLPNPVGKKIRFHDKEVVIAGVAKDFHFQNMRNPITPCAIFINPGWMWWKMYVKTKPGEASQAVASVQKLWKQYNADYDFNYKFLDESFDDMYRSDIHVGQLFNCFAGIAILISCLGLFGLVTYTAETKVKEIGIRKTLGATAGNIIGLLSRDFMKLVLVSLLVAFPLAWFMMNKWLLNYAYRTTLQWWVFAVAGACAFAIALLTVSSKAFRAAQSNPVKALRSE